MSASERGVGNSERKWSLRLFGGFELSPFGGGPKITIAGKRERILLAYLALSPRFRRPRRNLAAFLWGDAGDETLLDNLRTAVWRLRRTLEDDDHRLLTSDGEEIVLASSAFDIDVLKFRQLGSQSSREPLEEAAHLYTGGFLSSVDIASEEFEAWRRGESAQYRNQMVDILDRLTVMLTESGEIDRAIRTAERLVRVDRLNESANYRLMRLYCHVGRRGTAIQLYNELAKLLRIELNTEPDPELRRFFAEISGSKPQSSINALSTLGQSHVAKHTIQADAASKTLSIAVLPFINMSGDIGQEFFSDGITEEITTALIKIPDLHVVARTSAFEFKAKHQDIRAIGQALGASYVLEGAVRKSGERVRITTQLIRAHDGKNCWSETYDRYVTDIFVVQEDIAQSIAAALRIPLGLSPGQQLVPHRAIDWDAYQTFLRAKTLYRRRGAGIGEAISILESLVAHDPEYAPAWGLLARCYSMALPYSPILNTGSVEEARRATQYFVAKMEMAARRTMQFDPANAVGLQSLAHIQTIRGRWAESEDLFKKALALDPLDPDVLHYYSLTLAMVGKSKNAMVLREELLLVEPFDPIYNLATALVMWLTGQRSKAISIAEGMPADAVGGYYRNVFLSAAYAFVGRLQDAAEVLLLTESNQVSRKSLEDAVHLLKSGQTESFSPASLPVLQGELNFVYGHVGAVERLMDFPERNLAIGYLGFTAGYTLWLPEYSELRRTKRFKAYVQATGLVDYWRNRGWPDSCRAAGENDFVCE